MYYVHSHLDCQGENPDSISKNLLKFYFFIKYFLEFFSYTRTQTRIEVVVTVC